MKILVLGWEYPPKVAGGLGAACHGLTTALCAAGHDVLLALPETCRPFAPMSSEPARLTRVYVPVKAARPTRADGTDLRGDLGFHPYASDADGARRGESAHGSFGDQGTLYGPDLVQSVRRFASAAVETLVGLDFDVVHAHDWMTFPAAIQLRLHARRPICLHVHSTSLDRDGSLQGSGPLGLERGTIAGVERAGMRTADAVCAVSEYTRGVLLERFGARPESTFVVHNALDPSAQGDPSDVLGPANDSDRAPSDGRGEVLFLGRLTTQKGAGFLLRAAVRVLEERPETRFVIAGDGHERRALIELAAGLGIARHVFFPGAIDDDAKAKLYRQADLFVLPSISEPFGLTPLEALAHGTPALLSSQSGVTEVLPSAPAVAPWDTELMAEEILRLLGNTDKKRADRERLVEAGRMDLRTLSWDRSARTLLGVLGSLLPASRAIS